jgi:diguanylate cyclase (GGDEF)-like protein/PAS domain S-box-containing protein
MAPDLEVNLDTAILDAVRTAMTIKDADTRIIAFSQIASEITGYNQGRETEAPPSLAVIQSAVAAFEHFKATGVGSCQHESWCAPLRQLRAGIEQSQAVLNTVAHQIPVGFVLFDALGNITLLNEPARAIFGMPDEQLTAIATTGQQALDALDARWASDLRPLLAEENQVPRALAGETVLGEEIVVRHPATGEDVFLRLFVGPVTDSTGIITGASLAVVETGENRRMLSAVQRSEALARENEQLYRSLLEASPDGVLFTDPLGEILIANNVLAQMVDVGDAQNLIGRNILDFGMGVDRPRGHRLSLSPSDGTLHYERTLRTRQGTALYLDINAAAVPSDAGDSIGTVGIIRDVTSFKELEAALIRRVNSDDLTGLPNQRGLRAWLTEQLASRPHSTHSLLLVDLDRFKEINDTFGHHFGDRLLQRVEERLRPTLIPGDVLSRFGGDTFAIVAIGRTVRQTTDLAKTVHDVMAEPFDVDGHLAVAHVSVGIAMSPRDGRDEATLLQHADIAIAMAKSRHDGIASYSKRDNPYTPERFALISDLRYIVDRDQIMLDYQPKVDFATGVVCAFEALARWDHPTRGLLSPQEFIPLAEATGAIVPMTYQIMRKALAAAATWQIDRPDVAVAVNLSGRNLSDPELFDQLTNVLADSSVDASRVKIEVTETAIIQDPQAALQAMKKIRNTGLHLSLDDFGCGYTSLAHLQHFPIDEIKIDRSFVATMEADLKKAAIVKAIIDLGHSLGLKVVAEGVETTSVYRVLADLSCDMAQGYLLGRPASASEIPAMLLRHYTNTDDRAFSSKPKPSILHLPNRPAKPAYCKRRAQVDRDLAADVA